MNRFIRGGFKVLVIGATAIAPVNLMAGTPTPPPKPFVATPFAFETAPGRLPKSVLPLHYDIAITPNAAKHTLAGREAIELEFRSATPTIIFNSLNEKLSDVRLDGRPVAGVVSDDERQLTTVTLVKPAAVGKHRLSFNYIGKIESQPQGLFAQAYRTADGSERVLLSTQMESIDARRMFPCWDEPAFRATFKLSATVPTHWSLVSNMPAVKRTISHGLATTTFDVTPNMPSYLIEFTAGDLAVINAAVGPTQVGVYAVRGQEVRGHVALANAQQILADYNDYFGYSYPLPKLDSIAVPGGFAGAMENWGAITYNDQLLLLGESATVGAKQEVFSVQAHEMAHQWFGDLVTMGWWDDLWLNESFASWRAAKETNLRNPSWKWWEVQDADKEAAMHADARLSSHAIQQHVSNELLANNAFDPEITYSKGQAILRMFEAYLGEDKFRDGIRHYIRAHAYSNATTVDLWNSLGADAGQQFRDIASGWTEQPGFPLVNVLAHCDAGGKRTLSLSQQRFLLAGTDPGMPRWKIPLRIRVGREATRSLLLTRDEHVADAGRCEEPLSVNADAVGFYRVHYDAATLASNTKGFAVLPDGDRIALLDDEWALVWAELEPLRNYLALVSAMGETLDARAWSQIAEALSTIEYAERGASGHDGFAAYARSVLKPAAMRLGWQTLSNETPDVTKLRRTILTSLAAWGDPDIIAEARRRFELFAVNHKSLPADEQSTVLDIVGSYADAPTYARLHDIARHAGDQTELERYYGALMYVRDPALADQAAKIALSKEIPPQAATMRLGLVAYLVSWHHQLAWQTFSNNSKLLLEADPTFAPLIVSQYVPEMFWDSVPLTQLERWAREHVPAEMAPNVERGMESARQKLSQKVLLVRQADAFMAAH